MSDQTPQSVLFENKAATSAAGETKSSTAPKSNLELIQENDNFPYYAFNSDEYNKYVGRSYHLLVKDHVQSLGLMLPWVAETFRGVGNWEVNDEDRTVTLVTGNDRASRSIAIQIATSAMRATGDFEILKKWRGELYPVYGENDEILFEIERTTTPLFGVVTYGCHMTCFVRHKQPGSGRDEYKIWVPRRSRTKQTYPGMLDNTVGGGVTIDESPFTCIVREAAEEASLPEDLVREKAKAVGVVSYFHVRDERAGGETGMLQPECQYVYDLELDEDVIPKPNDDEVESFELMSTEAIKTALANGEFKPNCASILLDFFIRHGILTPENEKHYATISARLHRRLEFPVATYPNSSSAAT